MSTDLKPKHIVVIDGHPDPDPARYCHALVKAYADAARKAGHVVEVISCAELDFPILRTAADFADGTPPPAIAGVQALIRAADHIVIVYPLWLGTMPALLKAFLEQLMRPGFGFAKTGEPGWPKQLLTGKSARIVVTMGMPAFIYRWYYLAHGLRSLERNVLRFVGIGPIRETLIGGVEASPDQRAKFIAKMQAFGSAGA